MILFRWIVGYFCQPLHYTTETRITVTARKVLTSCSRQK
uniref:Uncharacterized protein n=1 Tax=Klebsiella pneumoniae TaxID=573 RepID=A0A8B0SW14_KLEPN|nr:hypothetical protein [Klebsiella pneumoniae]